MTREEALKRSRRRLALKITPLLLTVACAGTFSVWTFKGDIKNFIDNRSIFETVTNGEPTKPQYETEISETDMSETEEYNASEIIDVPTPDMIDVEKKENISSTLLDSGYEFHNIDFESLKSINSDACAWITIDGTSINYPIVQTTNNDYYLKKDIQENDSKSGTIFLDYRNNSLESKEYDLSDLSIIYGHNMRVGSMFAPICNYKSQSFYEKHPFGIVYTPDGCAYQAEFFAGVIISGKDDSELYTNDFIDEAIFDEYIRQIKSSSTFNSDVEIEFGDKILAMVTCSYEQQNYRYVLYAKLNKQLIYKPEVVPTKELNK